MTVKKGDWVEIESVVLTPSERSENLPDCTRETSLIMWIRGFLQNESAELNDEIEIMTLADRKVKGTLVEKEPRHTYDYGDTIIELIHIGEELKIELLESLQGGEK